MWKIKTTDRFDAWFTALDDTDRASVLAGLMVLRERGPVLPRPWSDTVKGSRHSNMKELRIQSRGQPIRAFFAFDPFRNTVVLCAGHKATFGKRFYDVMIPLADREFNDWLRKPEPQE